MANHIILTKPDFKFLDPSFISIDEALDFAKEAYQSAINDKGGRGIDINIAAPMFLQQYAWTLLTKRALTMQDVVTDDSPPIHPLQLQHNIQAVIETEDSFILAMREVGSGVALHEIIEEAVSEGYVQNPQEFFREQNFNELYYALLNRYYQDICQDYIKLVEIIRLHSFKDVKEQGVRGIGYAPKKEVW